MRCVLVPVAQLSKPALVVIRCDVARGNTALVFHRGRKAEGGRGGEEGKGFDGSVPALSQGNCA